MSLQSDDETMDAAEVETEEGRPRERFLPENINPRALVMLKRFLSEFMEFIESIENLESNQRPRKFKDAEQIGFINDSQ